MLQVKLITTTYSTELEDIESKEFQKFNDQINDFLSYLNNVGVQPESIDVKLQTTYSRLSNEYRGDAPEINHTAMIQYDI